MSEQATPLHEGVTLEHRVLELEQENRELARRLRKLETFVEVIQAAAGEITSG